ncbi:MAG: nuclear transport factor 2 family protein [candidate division WOR-3 bacterium]|nr:MAG: nuclear transport factor 2 family protein [candidate division WOR-3 bacterium]
MCIFLMSCSSDLSERVLEYAATYNAHDNEKLMSLYADDITFEIVGVWVKYGKRAVRELAEWDKATNMHMTVSNIRVSGDTVTFKLLETNDWWKLAGMGEVQYDPCVMVFRDGLISEMRAAMTQASVDAYARVWPSIINWAKKHRSEALRELLPDGHFIYGGEQARKWLALLHQWRSTHSRSVAIDEEINS